MEDGDRRRPPYSGGERADQFAPRCIAGRMEDPPARVRRLEPEPQLPVAIPIESDTEVCEVFDRFRCGIDDPSDRRLVAKSVAGRERVGEV